MVMVMEKLLYEKMLNRTEVFNRMMEAYDALGFYAITQPGGSINRKPLPNTGRLPLPILVSAIQAGNINTRLKEDNQYGCDQPTQSQDHSALKMFFSGWNPD
ncbi:hypothetical protein DUI87_20055 [Hirundo rustica rustica]|uniref:Uncharacterized protein n=1 Tax=Hirundo rustica rustica TaxID=333673 RepID=A0A3M0JPE8_HIRRU|nr:hypothetical protein DUI87_20055 [Hirundo rustica rustica]